MQQAPAAAPAASPGLVIGPNVDVSNEPGPQSETSVALDPTNLQHVIGGSNDIQSGMMRFYESTDGGKTFTNTAMPAAPAPTNAFSSDPAVAFGADGKAYYSFLGVDANAASTSLVCFIKPPTGAWGPALVVPATNPDKNLMVVDQNETGTSKFPGTAYINWDNNNPDRTQKVMCAYLRPGAKSFVSVPVNNTGNTVIGSEPKVGPDGTVYSAWLDYSQKRLKINSSTDGGASFGKTDNLIHQILANTQGALSVKIAADPQRGVSIFPFIDTDRSKGPNSGAIYAIFSDLDPQSKKGGLNILLRKSTDGGKSWSAPIQLNDDGLTAHDHFMPNIAVDPKDGSIHVVWYDTRNDPNNQKADIYYARSTDGGKTFSQNYKVTDLQSDEATSATKGGKAVAGKLIQDKHERHTSAEKHIKLFQELDANGYGDYLGLAALQGIVQPLWTDTRTGNEEVETARITGNAAPAAAPTPAPVKATSAQPVAFQGGGTTQAQLSLNDDVALADLKLAIDLEHHQPSTLHLTVTSPSGKKATLPAQKSTAVKGYFDLSKAFASESAKGTWTLHIHDPSKRDAGTLHSWTLDGSGAPRGMARAVPGEHLAAATRVARVER